MIISRRGETKITDRQGYIYDEFLVEGSSRHQPQVMSSSQSKSYRPPDVPDAFYNNQLYSFVGVEIALVFCGTHVQIFVRPCFIYIFPQELQQFYSFSAVWHTQSGRRCNAFHQNGNAQQLKEVPRCIIRIAISAHIRWLCCEVLFNPA